MSTNNKPLVSIITVTYNAVSVLEETILSVINQTYKNKEYIIIDGGSTDGTIDIIKKYEDKIDYWISEPDKGLYNAMNKAVEKATGRYCNFMNAGDIFYDDKVLERVFLNDSSADFMVGRAKTHTTTWLPVEKEKMSLFYLYKFGICHQAAFVRTDMLRRHPYDESLKIVADWKFFVESLILDNCSYRSLPYIICRFAKAGISSNQNLLDEEIQLVLSGLLSSRVASDYLLMKKYFNPLYRLLLPLVQTVFFQKIVFRLSGKTTMYLKKRFR